MFYKDKSVNERPKCWVKHYIKASLIHSDTWKCCLGRKKIYLVRNIPTTMKMNIT
jgi:hypothetical protein